MRISIGQAVEDGKTRVLDLQVEAGSDDALITEVVVSPASAFQTAPGVRVITTGRHVHELGLDPWETGEREREIAWQLEDVVQGLLGEEHEIGGLKDAYRERTGEEADGVCVLEQMRHEGWVAFPSDAAFVTESAHQVLQGQYDQVKKRVLDVADIFDILRSSVSETLGYWRNRGFACLPVSVTTGGPGHTNTLHELTAFLSATGLPYLHDNSDVWQRVISTLAMILRSTATGAAPFPTGWGVTVIHPAGAGSRQPMAGLVAKDEPYPVFDVKHGEYVPGDAAAHGAEREPFKPTVDDDARLVPRFMYEELQTLRRQVATARAALVQVSSVKGEVVSASVAADALRNMDAIVPRSPWDLSAWDLIHPSFHKRRGLDLKITDDDILRQTSGEEPSDQLKIRQLDLYGRHGGEILQARDADRMVRESHRATGRPGGGLNLADS